MSAERLQFYVNADAYGGLCIQTTIPAHMLIRATEQGTGAQEIRRVVNAAVQVQDVHALAQAFETRLADHLDQNVDDVFEPLLAAVDAVVYRLLDEGAPGVAVV